MNSDSLHISGEELQILRMMKRVKQKAMARSLRITQQAYSKMERSKKINNERLKTAIKAMDCSMEDLHKLKEIINHFSSR